MNGIECKQVLRAYTKDLNKIEKNKVTVSNEGLGFAFRRVIDTPASCAMIEGLQSKKPVGLDIKVLKFNDSYSIPEENKWNNLSASVESLGGTRINGGMGWVSFNFESEYEAQTALSKLQETAPSWIKVSADGKTINLNNETPVIDVMLTVDPKCL